MIFQPRHIKCIQIPQNGTTGLAESYRSFFVTNVETVNCKPNHLGGGTFEIVLKYNNRNAKLFGEIETIPTLIAMGFSLSNPWDTESPLTTPHPMPMVVETYNETHDLETDTHTITISGRGLLEVLLSNKVIMPKLVYQSPELQEPAIGFYPWDILVDVFGRNVNGEKTPNKLDVTTIPVVQKQYLLPDEENTDVRFISNVSLVHDIVGIDADPMIECTFEYDSLLTVFTNIITANNLYVSGQMKADTTGHLHFDYVLHRLADLTLGTSAPLVYDYGALPPKTYNMLLSTQERRDVAYIKTPPLSEGEASSIYTATRGGVSENNIYKGWFCKETFFDATSIPFIDNVNDQKYMLMLKYVAADELYKEDNMPIKVDDAEYLFTPMDYYNNCWPGCKYTSIGPDDIQSTLVITALVLTGSKKEGWIITPELTHYVEPFHK